MSNREVRIPSWEMPAIRDSMIDTIDDIADVAKRISDCAENYPVLGTDGFFEKLSELTQLLDDKYNDYLRLSAMVGSGCYLEE